MNSPSWRLIACACILFLFNSCQEQKSTPEIESVIHANDLHHANRRLIEVAMEDNFPPMVAARVYVYPHIAAYEVLSKAHPDRLPGLTGKLNELTDFPAWDTAQIADPGVAALAAFAVTARKYVFSEHHMVALLEELKALARERGLPEQKIEASVAYGTEAARSVISWADKDNYGPTRTKDRFTASQRPGDWRQTPPDYISALEPYWQEIRTMVLPSRDAFAAKRPPAYDPAKDSDFYKMVAQVYDVSRTLTQDQIETALFWDDNPNSSEHRGHLTVMVHKISPAGHWLNIASQVCRSADKDIFTSAQVYTYGAISMFDGFISCWYEKFQTNLVRPVTYIQEFIDPSWKPLIQTPPFPEYTSGHSAISAAAAVSMGRILGDPVSFTDSTEIEFGLTVRSFPSLDSAAREAGISRFYGGIHYIPALDEGYRQGKFVADMVLNKIMGTSDSQ